MQAVRLMSRMFVDYLAAEIVRREKMKREG